MGAMLRKFHAGAADRPFVFVSHLKEDKPKLKPILKQLIERGFHIWIDSPDQLGLNFPDVRDHHGALGRIAEGHTWDSEIAVALQRCAVVLVIWTGHSKAEIANQPRRHVFKSEVDAGMARDIVVPVVLEGSSGGRSVYERMQAFQLQQWPHSDVADRAFEALCEHLQGMLGGMRDARARPAEGLDALDDLGPAAAEAAHRARNGDRGMRLFQLACERLDPSASRDVPGAIRLLRVSAACGSAAAMYRLGLLRRDGEGLPASRSEAHALWREAAARGYPRAQYMLGCDLMDSDPQAARLLFREAAEFGHCKAQYNLADAQLNGLGGDVDDEAALAQYRSAAALGYFPAAYMAGMILLGRDPAAGTPLEEALDLLRFAVRAPADDSDSLIAEAAKRAREELKRRSR